MKGPVSDKELSSLAISAAIMCFLVSIALLESFPPDWSSAGVTLYVKGIVAILGILVAALVYVRAFMWRRDQRRLTPETTTSP